MWIKKCKILIKSWKCEFNLAKYDHVFSLFNQQMESFRQHKKKKTRTVREREILAPLLTDLERFGHRSSTGGCKRLVEANFWAITAWTLRLCKRNFLLFSFSIWRDLVKGFYFFEKDCWRSSYSFTAISFWFFVSIDPSFAFWFGVS